MNDSIIYVSRTGNAKVSYNNGSNWNTLPIVCSGERISFKDGTLFFSDNQGYSYSLDSGNYCFYNQMFNWINDISSESSFRISDTLVSLCGKAVNGNLLGYSEPEYGIISTENYENQFQFVQSHFTEMDSINDVELTEIALYAATSPEFSNGRFIKSTDNGISWYTLFCSEPVGISSAYIREIEMYDDTSGFAIGENKIYKTTNGGGTPIQPVGFLFNAIIENNNFESSTLFPNPSNDKIDINSLREISAITLFDCAGKKLKEYFSTSGINVSDLSPGMYFVKVGYKSSQTETIRFIKTE
ncbi:MAG: T9SS type A sorting domain-containing protein [Bacteroidota bacterium]